ncbi:MAG: TRAP transporter large permease subunit [Rhodospirillaceae bacterium]|nr:TRAP transporter large permease subunit [Rhodospirillaceae bacterium]
MSTDTHYHRSPYGTVSLVPRSALAWVVLTSVTIMAVLVAVELANIAFFFEPYVMPDQQEVPLWTLQGILSDIDIATLSIVMFGSLLALLALGLPLVFVTGSLGVVFIYLVGDALMLNIIPSRIFPLMTNYQLSAIPLFIFMASMLERAGLIDEMFDVIYKWLGGFSGGLAAATIVASTILAAMVGVIGAAVVTMGLIALPAMLKRKYDPQIALGSIMAGGTLGILIPPSILAIIYAVVAQESVGELYLGSVIPGLLLSGLYIVYVTTRSALNPKLGPALPLAERVSFAQKLLLLRRMLAPVLLIVLVLGVIFSGAATPVEAAAIGSFGAMVVAGMHGRLSWVNVRDAAVSTMRASAMVLWIIFGATIFVGFYILQGGQAFVSEVIFGTGLDAYGVLLLMMLLLIFLGMFLDWVGILLLAVPIFIPIIQVLEFDGLLGLPGVDQEHTALWFGVLYLVNMQMSFLSPPFGYALFYMRGVAPKEISTAVIFRSALPFLALQAFGLTLCVLFPEIVLWLPRLAYG